MKVVSLPLLTLALAACDGKFDELETTLEYFAGNAKRLDRIVMLSASVGPDTVLIGGLPDQDSLRVYVDDQHANPRTISHHELWQVMYESGVGEVQLVERLTFLSLNNFTEKGVDVGVSLVHGQLLYPDHVCSEGSNWLGPQGSCHDALAPEWTATYYWVVE